MSLQIRVANALRGFPAGYRTVRAARLLVGRTLPPRRLNGIPGRVHWNDLMLPGRGDQAQEDYAATGRYAVTFLDRATQGTAKPLADPSARVLDFGCGHGRVVRFLVAHRGPGGVVCCDLDPEAAAFCASEFGVQGVKVDVDLDPGQLGEPFDLIWMGSVLTHLTNTAGSELVAKLLALLNSKGTLAFSTHGDYSLDDLEALLPSVGASESEIRREVGDVGYCYRKYRHYSGADYGLMWHSPDYVLAWMRDTFHLVLVDRESDAWGQGRQDLWAFRRA